VYADERYIPPWPLSQLTV